MGRTGFDAKRVLASRTMPAPLSRKTAAGHNKKAVKEAAVAASEMEAAKAAARAVPRGGGASAKPDAGIKKSRRFRPGTVALREIRRYQKSTEMLLPRVPFRRLLDTIAADFKNDGQRFSATAVTVLMEASQAYVVDLLAKGQTLALHARRKTLKPHDIELSRHLCYTRFE